MSKVLIIEDNPGDAKLIKWYLSTYSDIVDEIFWAEDLESGIKIIGEKDVSIILLDLSLPDSQGLETLQKVLESHPRIPVVVLTGLQDEETGLKAIQDGAQDYLLKGKVGKQVLLRSIRYALARDQQKKDMNREWKKRITQTERDILNEMDAVLNQAAEESQSRDYGQVHCDYKKALDYCFGGLEEEYLKFREELARKIGECDVPPLELFRLHVDTFMERINSREYKNLLSLKKSRMVFYRSMISSLSNQANKQAGI